MKRITVKLAVACLLASVSSTFADPALPAPDYASRTKTVTATATGAGDGTTAKPWTLQQAMEQCAAGDIIGIEAGIYTGEWQRSEPPSADVQDNIPAFYPRASGTAANPIVFVAQYPAATTAGPYTEIRSGGQRLAEYPAPLTPRNGWPCFGSPFDDASSYIHLIGVYMNERNPDSHIYEDCGLITVWSGSNWKISKCKLMGDPQATSYASASGGGNNYTGIRLERADDVEISDCWFEDWYPNQAQVNNTSFMSYSSQRTIFEHNYIKNAGYGWYQKGANGLNVASQGGEFRYNRVEDCWAGWRIMAPFTPPKPGAPVPTLITNYHNNLCLRTQKMFDYSQTAQGALGTLSRVFNNTIVTDTTANENTALWMEGIYSDHIVDNNFYNNIVDGFDWTCLNYGATIAEIVQMWPRDYNLWRGHSYLLSGSTEKRAVTESIWQDTYGQDVHSIFNVDPQFVGNDDYRLQPGSPCENTGKGGINMGCYITGTEVIGIRSATPPGS